MTGAVVMLFLVLAPLTGLALWYRKTYDAKDRAYAGQHGSTRQHAPRPQARSARPVAPQPPVVTPPLTIVPAVCHNRVLYEKLIRERRRATRYKKQRDQAQLMVLLLLASPPRR